MTDLFSYSFFVYALIGVLFISVSAAMIGTYVISRRLVAISGGVTHACFGGLGLGYFLGISPVLMAGVFAVGSSIGVEWAASRFRIREDSAIAVIWAIGMAIGVLFVFMTPGYVPELNSFLFGNILTISRGDLLTFAVFTLLLCAFFLCARRQIVACAFDRDFARVIGIPARLINYVMTVFVAVCIVLTIRLVGVMLLMSMLSLPVMTAELFCRRFVSIMYASTGISVACSLIGLFAGTVADIPCSAFIVLINAAVFIIAKIISSATWKTPDAH